MFPSFAFLWLSPVLGWKGWLFRKGWAGVEGPPHQAEGGTCPLEITFSLLFSFGPLSSSWCYRGGGVRALGKVGLPIFSDWPSPTSHFMSCKILYVFKGLLSIPLLPFYMSISCLVPIAAAALGGLVLQERLGKVLSAIALPWAFFFFWLPVLAAVGREPLKDNGGLFLSPLATITF